VPVRGADDELDEVAVAFNQALARVEHAVGEMRQFSSALAHELRTPLAVLRGETELALRETTLPGEVRQRLAGQLDELDKLSRLINQILTLARAEAGQIVLAREPVNLSAMAASVAEQLDAVAEAQGLRLTCLGPPDVTVRGDAGWLERLLLILIDNAIKFTAPGGEVRLTVSGQGATAVIAVSDTGVGIDRESLPNIFKQFFRADPSRSRQVEGAGLGLALAKWIVDHHGGRIDVTSRPKQGSTFAVHLPLEPAGEFAAASPEAERDA
jgi:signal transduction histidine kinase